MDATEPIKLLLMGESGVGKTSFLSCFVCEKIDSFPQFYRKSLSIDELGGRTITFDIWDTPSQKNFSVVAKVFCKNARAAIFIYDITQKKSFDEIKNFYYQQIKKFAPKDIVLGIAANKCDLNKEEQVSKEEEKQFADEIGAIFEETTKENNTGIQRLFKRISCKILKS